MKLYFTPRSSATRPRWLLEELGVPYELVKLDFAQREHQTAAYLQLHPFGEVPALVDGDLRLFESLAICFYLADYSPEAQLAPSLGSPERARYMQWLIFAETRLEPVVKQFLNHSNSPEPANAQIYASLNHVLGIIDTELDGRDFIAAGHFTAADLVLASILHLANAMKLLEGYPRLVKYVYFHCQRPALQRAVTA
ncbi:glutathione S-transferase family protein [Solimicrobium silvestre]|uniref:Glutathione S-transferase n=1 Tax=Solimicrobium silvestre TaxID=2099400 RepID=A0A2S9GSR4_9BURK|nr:glutathione S-transferase family protein [Solimicrobium silvestre]PRC90745.1 Glutathione S-transferase [Solimicrobium silvestre]